MVGSASERACHSDRETSVTRARVNLFASCHRSPDLHRESGPIVELDDAIAIEDEDVEARLPKLRRRREPLDACELKFLQRGRRSANRPLSQQITQRKRPGALRPEDISEPLLNERHASPAGESSESFLDFEVIEVGDQVGTHRLPSELLPRDGARGDQVSGARPAALISDLAATAQSSGLRRLIHQTDGSLDAPEARAAFSA